MTPSDVGPPLAPAPVGVLRMIAYVVGTFSMVPLQYVLMRLGSPLMYRTAIWFHRWAALCMGLRLVARGQVCHEGPVLYVANHSSYLDVDALGSLLRGSFVAKAELDTWPVMGWLARLQRTVYVDRKRSSSHKQRDDIKSRLEDGDNLILFPEGTSSDGNRTLPFKSALFAVASIRVDDGKGGQRPLKVQPISITCTQLDGLPLGRQRRPLYAWYGQMTMWPHVWHVFRTGPKTVEVDFHPPVDVDMFGGSRKALAQHCWQTVAEGVSRQITGRPALAA